MRARAAEGHKRNVNSYIASMSDVEHDGDGGVLEKTMKEGEAVGSRMGVRPAEMTGSMAACKCGTRTERL